MIGLSRFGYILLPDTQRKSFLHGKQMCYTRQRTHRSYFKRRFFEHRSVSTSNGGIFRMEVSNMHEKNSNNVKVYNPHGTDIQGLLHPKDFQFLHVVLCAYL